jgi:hypothetical protein
MKRVLSLAHLFGQCFLAPPAAYATAYPRTLLQNVYLYMIFFLKDLSIYAEHQYAQRTTYLSLPTIIYRR